MSLMARAIPGIAPLSFSDLLNGLDHHFGLPLLLPFGSVVFCPSGSWGCIPFFLWAWVAFWGCSFWCLFFFRGCSFSFLWRGRWCLFFLWWGWCVVFLCCCCCWGWCLFFLCRCCWCLCWCCSFGRSLVFLWGGWWLGWWVSLGLLLLWGWWLGRGHPHGLWVGAEVHNFIGLVRLPPRLPLVQLLMHTLCFWRRTPGSWA